MAISKPALAVVLAAGEGTRMKSAKPKVLHEIAGLSMLGWTLRSLAAADVRQIAVVVGPGREDVATEARRHAPGASVFVQAERRGTAHAVLAARDAIVDASARGAFDLLVAFADTPLVEPSTYGRLRAALGPTAAVAALAFRATDPTGYGRMLVREGALTAIREHKDANADDLKIDLCNAGLMALEGAYALALLDAVRADNSQREFYLTDAVEAARARRLGAVVVEAPESETMGVNDRVQLAAAEAIRQRRLREAAMRGGATLVDPSSVTLCHDTALAPDVRVEPHCVFGPGVRVASGASIRAFSHLEGAEVGEGATIGPFARLRPGARIATGAHVGNFVEIKQAEIGEGAKVNHLTYVGDATVGARANVGAGTITCNYDGFDKNRTIIGAGAFVGSNSALVAPVTIGEGAYVGSGSVITKDVPAGALAIGRGAQVEKAGWAKAFRQRKTAAKEAAEEAAKETKSAATSAAKPNPKPNPKPNSKPNSKPEA